MIRPEIVIPMHYNTFEVISADPLSFRDQVPQGVRTEILKSGQVLEI